LAPSHESPASNAGSPAYASVSPALRDPARTLPSPWRRATRVHRQWRGRAQVLAGARPDRQGLTASSWEHSAGSGQFAQGGCRGRRRERCENPT